MCIDCDAISLIYLIGIICKTYTDYRMRIEYLRGYFSKTLSQGKTSVGGCIVVHNIVKHFFKSESRHIIERGDL